MESVEILKWEHRMVLLIVKAARRDLEDAGETHEIAAADDLLPEARRNARRRLTDAEVVTLHDRTTFIVKRVLSQWPHSDTGPAAERAGVPRVLPQIAYS